MAYSVSNSYKQVIYSQEDQNDLKIWFNGVELEDAGYYVEKVTCKARIMPDDGKKRFSLDNFISKEVEVILHNVNLETIQDQVTISIGTFVDNNYEYVPIGTFNIQDTPTSNNNTITLKLRDNRVKFDFNYNAQPLIEANDGSATYKQILNDICEKAGVISDVTSFDNEDIETAFYDNSITATVYVSYIAEQCGMIPVITREGHLDFIDIMSSTTWQIPLSIVSDNYEVGEPYTIERTVYESGIIKYESSADDTLSTLYINSANPYIIQQQQVDDINTKLTGYTIDSVKMTNAILGNPAIDPWDLIEVYDDEDENETVIFTTLANYDYVFNGTHRQTFSSEIGIEQRTENVTKSSESSFKSWATTTINQLEGTIELTAGQIDELRSEQTSMLVDINSIQNLFQISGGSNLIKNSQFLLTDAVWEFTEDPEDANAYHTPLGQGYNGSLIGQTVAVANIVLRDSTATTTENNITNLKLNVTHTLSYYISQDTYTTSTVTLTSKNTGEVVYEDTVTTTNQAISMQSKSITFTTTDTDYTLSITTSATYSGYTTIYDLMLNIGENKSWESAASEIYSTILKMSQMGMQVFSSGSNIITLLTSDGFQIREASEVGGQINIGRIISEFDRDGLSTDTATMKKAIIGSYIEEEMTLSNVIHHIEYFMNN